MEKVTIVLCAFLVYIHAESLPPEIKTCKRSNSDYSTCLLNAVEQSMTFLANGNKDLNLPTLDPISIPEIFIAGSGGSVDLEQTYTDLKIYGLGNMKYKRVNIDIEGDNCKLELDVLAPRVEMIGTVKLVGKLLLITLGGTSAINTTIVNLGMDIAFKCKKQQKGAEIYLDIIDNSIDLKPEKLIFGVKNIIAGNKVLSENVETVLNENHMDIFAEVKNDYEKAFGKVFELFAAIFFKKVPIDEVFLP